MQKIFRELCKKGAEMKVKYDRQTKAWFWSHKNQQTTVCMCDKCGLFYKPSLGHKCKVKEQKNELL